MSVIGFAVQAQAQLNVGEVLVSHFTQPGAAERVSANGTVLAASSGFQITAASTEAQRAGAFFYGLNGGVALPWSASSTSFMCVKAPLQRTELQTASGTIQQCNGSLTLDFNAWRVAHPTALGQPLQVGQVVSMQCWFRDPLAAKGTSLSDALRFVLQP